ncbi:hypothetical protein [Paraburkholderia sp. ZP32-5]|uniref:hypothetical protein n=1 Tax=Paraburkholderia sp. ZP32-5 TaxID=2883245 RepID=UPI001F2F36BF|nr:hypothetical protein [Paraburkholderia sp. ZP32-5]
MFFFNFKFIYFSKINWRNIFELFSSFVAAFFPRNVAVRNGVRSRSLLAAGRRGRPHVLTFSRAASGALPRRLIDEFHARLDPMRAHRIDWYLRWRNCLAPFDAQKLAHRDGLRRRIDRGIGSLARSR